MAQICLLLQHPTRFRQKLSLSFQAYIQTNEDNLDREIQTEEIETSEKWTQHPAEDIVGSGGPDDQGADLAKEHKPVDTVKLNRFIEEAGQVRQYIK